MFTFPRSNSFVQKCAALAAIISVFAVSSAFARTADRNYEVELVVSDGKKSVETDAVLTIKDTTFTVVPDKQSFKSEAKEFTFTDLTRADHSFSKKPMLSGGGAVATALLVGFIFALPFLFIKKKKHWMTVQTKDDFAVIKLGDGNFRQIVAEFETHGVKVAEIDESKKKDK